MCMFYIHDKTDFITIYYISSIIIYAKCYIFRLYSGLHFNNLTFIVKGNIVLCVLN